MFADGIALASCREVCVGRLATAYRGTAARSPAATAAIGSNSGMGLAIAAGLVQAHHGEISACNQDVGCRFEVLLPLLHATSA